MVNGDVERGMTGWSDQGFAVVSYGVANTVTRPSGGNFGLFQATAAGARLEQDVSLSALASYIDADDQTMTFAAALGGSGPGADGARASVEWLDGSGQPLGDPVVLGPPTAADRRYETAMLGCRKITAPPVGTRAARVLVEAVADGGTSHATADDVSLIGNLAETGGAPVIPAQGPNCLLPPPASVITPVSDPTAQAQPTASPLATPTPTPTITVAPTPTPTGLRASHIELQPRHLSLRLSAAGRARIAIDRRTHRGHWRRRQNVTLNAPMAGTTTVTLHHLTPGFYRITVRTDATLVVHRRL